MIYFVKKYLLSLLIFVLSSNVTINANSYSIFGGLYDYDDDNTTNLFGLNYHISNSEIELFNILTINPVIGGLITLESASMFYGGFETNIGLDKIYLNLSSSAGIYSNGDGKDLGSALQFKSEVNLFYNLSKESRLGIGSHHISNAGLDSVNPGTNNFYLIYNRNF